MWQMELEALKTRKTFIISKVVSFFFLMNVASFT